MPKPYSPDTPLPGVSSSSPLQRDALFALRVLGISWNTPSPALPGTVLPSVLQTLSFFPAYIPALKDGANSAGWAMSPHAK